MNVRKILALAALTVSVSTTAVAADDVIEEIDRARKLYQDGKIEEARQSLDMASQLIAQHKARILGEVLPQPMTGWTAEDPASAVAGASLFGGGISASRIYRRGAETCLISVVGDSPAMAMVNIVFSNPNMASAAGAKVQRIAGQRGLITSDGEVQVISNNNYLVTVSGSCREADKIAYASNVDYGKLAGF